MNEISKTTAVSAIEECVAYSRLMVEASAVSGPAGVGKTTALQWIAHKDKTATLIHVDSERMTPRAFWTTVANAMRLWANDRAGWQILDVVISNLRHPSTQNEIFLFDEAQNIPQRQLKDIVDWPQRFGVPVVLCGNAHLLKRTRAEGAAFDQIDSRIGKRVRLHNPSREDFEAIAKDFGVFGVDAKNACAAYGARNSIRALKSLLNAARVEAEGEAIGLEHIRRAVIFKVDRGAVSQLLPYEFA